MTTTMTRVCPKCGVDNRLEAKRCRNRSCQGWFKIPERTEEWKQKISNSNKEYWDKFWPTEEGQKIKDKISSTLSTPEAKERSRKLFLEHCMEKGRTPEANQNRAAIHKQLRKENPDKYWGGFPVGKQFSSKIERSLKPYLEPIGFIHTENSPISIVKNGKRKWPDFYNPETRQVVEVLGTYWHRDRILPEGKTHQTPTELISWYKESDWDCVVVWENEIDEFKKSLRGIA